MNQDDSSPKKKGKGTMLVTINQDEIAEAVQTFVQSRGISIEGQDVKVTFTAGRGTNGMAASIEITPKVVGAKKPSRKKTSTKTKEVKSVLQEEAPEVAVQEEPEVEAESILETEGILPDPVEEADPVIPESPVEENVDDAQESLFGN
jgi:hypothetical protein